MDREVKEALRQSLIGSFVALAEYLFAFSNMCLTLQFWSFENQMPLELEDLVKLVSGPKRALIRNTHSSCGPACMARV